MIKPFIVQNKRSNNVITLFAKNRKQAIMNMIRIEQSRDFMVPKPRIMPGVLEKVRRVR